MVLSPGSRLGPYEIVAPIGAGGMGEVYKARDTRLDRTVAVKVLPAHLSASADVRQRFEREAKTISSLSHPHICALYDVGNQDGVEFLVMEYLEGQTLSDRLVKGPLGFDQVLRFGLEMADALDKAHRQGIVHRDLKPANVMITKSGVKLLDFGLAKAVAPTAARSGASLTALPTQAGKDLTAEGTILGTFQYMAPEQLEGRDADARTDIFAFGAVLYEMATGKKAFSGRSQASLISSIMTSEPAPASSVAPTAPPAFDRVVRTCLAKDPDDRWQTAHDIAVQLKWIQEGSSSSEVSARTAARRPRGLPLVPWIVATFAIAALAGILVRDWRRPNPKPPVTRFSVLPPEKTMFTPPGDFSTAQFALSPDGRSLAFVASEFGGRPRIWVRPLGGLNAAALPGTEDATLPFWSPDGRSIAYFTQGTLMRVDVAGGAPTKICDVSGGRGGAWSSTGVILVSQSSATALLKVSEAGGTPQPASAFDPKRGDTSQRWPEFLPDGRRFLFWLRSSKPENNGIYVGSLDSRETRLVVASESKGMFAPPGHLLLVRDQRLLAYDFDLKSASVRGQPFSIAESVPVGNPPGYAAFSVADEGAIAYAASFLRSRELVWLDRSGKLLGKIGEPGDYTNPRLSPDGKRLAVAMRQAGTMAATDIWVLELARGAWTRLTFEPSNERTPIWTPDSTRLFYAASPRGLLDIYQTSVTGAGTAQPIVESDSDKFPSDCSPDGRFLTYSTFTRNSSWDVWVAPLDGGKPIPIATTPFVETQGKFSPDGRWFAWASDESGRFEVQVTSFPKRGGKWQVSTNGGTQPWWRGDGKELFYLGLDQKMMSVPIRVSGDAIEAGVPAPLFEANFPPTVAPFWRGFAVTNDGQKFLLAQVAREAGSTPINIVLNWAAEHPK